MNELTTSKLREILKKLKKNRKMGTKKLSPKLALVALQVIDPVEFEFFIYFDTRWRQGAGEHHFVPKNCY